MPHIVGQDDATDCLAKTYANSETIHANIESGMYTGHKLEQAKKEEEKLQTFTDKLNKELDKFLEVQAEILG